MNVRGLYVQSNGNQMEPSVQVEYSGGMQNSISSSDYIEKGYEPWLNMLPSMEEYFEQQSIIKKNVDNSD